MTNKVGICREPNYRLALQSSCLVSLLLVPALTAAQQEPLVDAVAPSNPQQLDDSTNAPAPFDTHATRQASSELLQRAALQPDSFIGKTLVLIVDTGEVTVGPVLDLRRRLENQELYLIVDATSYFNTTINYAVSMEDVGRVDGDSLVIPEAPGMHLRGFEYHAEDYADIEVLAPAQE